MNEGDLVFFNWHMQPIEENRIGLVLEDLGPFLKLHTKDNFQISNEIMVSKNDVETFKSRIHSNPFHKLTFRLGYLISRLNGEFVSTKSASNELEGLFAYDSKIDFNKVADNDRPDNLVELTHREIPFFNPVKLFSVFSNRGIEKPLEMLRANPAFPQKQDTSKILRYTKYDSWKSYEQGISVNELLNKKKLIKKIIR